jgi:cytochrome c5
VAHVLRPRFAGWPGQDILPLAIQGGPVRVVSIVVLAAMLGACDDAPPPQDAAPPPPTAHTGKLYAQTCMACHTNPGSGAPQAGDAAAWRPRLRQGMDVLLDRTIDGYKGMPPLGSCMDCNEADFEALIRLMAGDA